MEITYRNALPTDAAALLEYLKTIGGESGNLSFGPEGLPFTVAQEEAFLTSLQNDPDYLMLLAMDGEEIVGNASVSRHTRARFAHRWDVAISVRKSHWGKGIGSYLMTQLIEFAKNSGAEVVSLEVRSDNERAKSLYRKFGFKKFGTYRKFFKIDGAYFDADYMNLYL